MAVAKTRLLEPLDYITLAMNPQALVIGGGVAGLTTALGLAGLGYQVDLVERRDHAGRSGPEPAYHLDRRIHPAICGKPRSEGPKPRKHQDSL